ncbi:ParA family protein [Algibacillus agarilyticus]|uniref:ParA family protein n=1 Tax=Algibacillus agarilyticus TaxID=2234133 RepID=UPI000DCFFB2E|nr:ParA family protein [Algibacillus agarilyticus]
MTELEQRIIAVGGLKGGVGKTTIVELLAVESAYRGKKVAIFDMDPQGSGSRFVARRNEFNENTDDPVPTIMNLNRNPAEKDVRKTLLQLSKDYDFIFVDLVGGNDYDFVVVAMIADTILSPCSDSAKEFEQLPRVFNAIEKAEENLMQLDPDGNNRIDLRILLNQLHPSSIAANKELRDIIIAKYGKYASLCNVEFTTKKAFTKTGQGLTVTDYGDQLRSKPQLLLDEVIGVRKPRAIKEGVALDGIN